MYGKNFKWICLVFLAALAGLVPARLAAQDSSTQPSRWDIFAGYSYLAPRGTVQVPLGNGNTAPYQYDAVNLGGDFSGAYFFNRFFGVQGEYAEHEWGSWTGSFTNSVGTHGNDDGFQTFAGGIIFRFPQDHFTPFAHALVGGAVINGPFFEQNKLGPDITIGGGMDYDTPLLNHRLALRLFQADYEYMHADFGQQVSPPGGRANINAARLSAGVVFHIGSLAPPPPVTLACSASPQSVFPGEPVTVTATAGTLDPKDNVIYTWSGSGVTGTGATATVATANLAPGQYTVQCGVKEGKPGKEGLKPWESATGSASFTVKDFEPPTISCSVSPTTIKPGDTATVTSVGVSPQNRPLTYSYTATAGTITGTGTTAEYSSAGAPTGAVGVSCNVSDDKNHSASGSTSLTITAPYVPPVPKTQALCTISFSNDSKRPMRVDNEAKACLDQVALDLKQQADAKAVIVGEQSSDEAAKTAKQQAYAAKHKRAMVDQFAAQRAVNTKDYLVTEQGIDASRISVATGSTDGQTVENYLVPSGATFGNDITGTNPVDETAVKPQERKPLAEKRHHKAAMKMSN